LDGRNCEIWIMRLSDWVAWLEVTIICCPLVKNKFTLKKY
jgi:hypothetical protein